VFQRGTPPDAVYAFKHALVQTRRIAACCAALASNCTHRSPMRSKQFPRDDGEPTRAPRAALSEAGSLKKSAICWAGQGIDPRPIGYEKRKKFADTYLFVWFRKL